MFEVFIKLFRTYCFGSMWLPFSNIKDFTYLFPGILRITEVNITYTLTDKLVFPSACPFKFLQLFSLRVFSLLFFFLFFGIGVLNGAVTLGLSA